MLRNLGSRAFVSKGKKGFLGKRYKRTIGNKGHGWSKEDGRDYGASARGRVRVKDGNWHEVKGSW